MVQKPRGLVWHTGPGLHRVSPQCEHVLVDCTPKGLLDLPSEKRHAAVMREKALALAWHLRSGVLRDEQDNRIVVFCNTIDNCREIENQLRKLDPQDARSGRRRWKVLVLHGLRKREDYQNAVEEFNGERVKATDFFKKRVLVCTDRLSRGIDFSSQPVNWVVLLDWPRDASEYLRRVGRTARGGGHGGVLAFLSGINEVRDGKMITSAAIRSLPLQRNGGGGGPGTVQHLAEKAWCLERFNPLFTNWRAAEAAAPLPRGSKAAERMKVEPSLGDADTDLEETLDSVHSQDERDEVLSATDSQEIALAESQWTPWMDGRRGSMPNGQRSAGKGQASVAHDMDDYGDDEGDLSALWGASVGVSLYD